MRFIMRPFRYLADPLFLVCFVAYFVNRFGLKPHVGSAFLHDHFNDAICIPFWVPIMLWIQRRAGLRADDDPPRPSEIVIPLIVWSVTFEVWLPRTEAFRAWCTADPADVLAYAAGAMAAAVWWRWWYARPTGSVVRLSST
jgi:hypothetical protein